MSLTSDLKKSVRDIIKTIIPTAAEANTQVDTDGVDLYCFYNLGNTVLGNVDNRDSKTKALQIDLWYTNADQDLTSIDEATDDLEELFSECSYIETDFYYDGYLTARNDNITTGDENIHHNQLLIELRYNKYDLTGEL